MKKIPKSEMEKIELFTRQVAHLTHRHEFMELIPGIVIFFVCVSAMLFYIIQ